MAVTRSLAKVPFVTRDRPRRGSQLFAARTPDSTVRKNSNLNQFRMGKVKKSICRWFWGMLVAFKLAIYCIKCPIWTQSLMFVTTGCPKQLKKCMKKHLNLHKALTKALNAFGTALKVERGFLLLLRSLSEVAPSSGSSQQITFFIEIEL